LGDSLLPEGWVMAAGLAALAALLAIPFALLRRRRRNRPLLLAAPAKRETEAEQSSASEPARIDLQLDIINATRSVMMFTFEYRLELANRADKAVRDVRLTTRIGYPGKNPANVRLAETAEDIQTIARVGPHQSRSITGTLRLPLAEIVPMRQGHAPLLIPLMHIMIEAAGRALETYTFVIGTPSNASVGRLHPILLDTPPGSIASLRAQVVQAPGTAGSR
jgi:hypothetical protein